LGLNIKIMKRNYFQLIIVLFLLSCSVSKDLTDDLYSSEWTSFENETYHISYPNKLNFKEASSSSKNITKIFLMSGKGSTEPKDFISVNLLKEKVSGDYANLDTYTTVSLININSVYKIKKFTKQKAVKHGLEYYQFNYQVKMSKIKMFFIQRLYLVDDTAYVLTYNCSKKYYQSHLKTALKILDSFVLI